MLFWAILGCLLAECICSRDLPRFWTTRSLFVWCAVFSSSAITLILLQVCLMISGAFALQKLHCYFWFYLACFCKFSVELRVAIIDISYQNPFKIDGLWIWKDISHTVLTSDKHLQWLIELRYFSKQLSLSSHSNGASIGTVCTAAFLLHPRGSLVCSIHPYHCDNQDCKQRAERNSTRSP